MVAIGVDSSVAGAVDIDLDMRYSPAMQQLGAAVVANLACSIFANQA